MLRHVLVCKGVTAASDLNGKRKDQVSKSMNERTKMVKQTRHIGVTLVAAVAALALVSTPANARAHNEFGGESTARSIEQDPITLHVVNGNNRTVDVYAVVERGKLSKIGRVNGQDSRCGFHS